MQVSKVLVVDGDRAVRDALVTCLRFIGLDAHGAEDALAARTWLVNDAADVLVISDPLPDGMPEDLLTPEPALPSAVVVLAHAASAGRKTNYRADVTLLRPVSVGRVAEQVESLLRTRETLQPEPCDFGKLSLDPASLRLEHRGECVHLGRTETRLLRFFMEFPDKVFSRAQLLERLWPPSVRVEQRTVDVHIRRLRQSLESLGCADYVQTVRGSGYRFSAMPQ